MKIIKVKSCWDCPYSKFKWMKCEHGLVDKSYNTIEDINIIPEWCPLEDEIDFNHALDLLQTRLGKGAYIGYGEYCTNFITRKLGLYDKSGEEITSGKTLKELLVNLVKLKEG